jgi:transposase
MAELAQGQLRKKIPLLQQALLGNVTSHHKFMLTSLLAQIDHIDGQVRSFDTRIEEVMNPLEKEAIKRLDEVPGFDRRSGQNVIAEIGTDMSRFPTAHHLAS